MGKRILLVEPDYYTQYPPISLLKLSAYHKSQKDGIIGLVRGMSYPKEIPDRIYITSLFTWAWRPVHDAIKYYKAWFPDAEVWLGGLYASLSPKAELSGADYIYKGIFKEAEDLLPDYELLESSDRWKDWDGSIIFSTRGCPFECGYCAVPILEGKINSVKHSIKELIYSKHTRIIFFDNNILASSSWRSIFDELEDLKRRVDFNQGLDARFINDEVAEKLSRLKLDSMIRLAYDRKGARKFVGRAIEILNAHGIKKRNIMVYCLFNYTDDPQDFFGRVREILNWGVVAYPMRYEPIYTLEKNKYISPKWDTKRIDMVQRARRVIGYRGAFPPYEGLVKKFNKAKDFDKAFKLRPRRRH